MLKSTRESLKAIDAQIHNNFISGEEMKKALEYGKKIERWNQETKRAEAKKKAELEKYRRGNFTEEEKAALENGFRKMLDGINQQLNRNITRESKFWDDFNKHEAAKKEHENVERLLEIAEDRNDYLKAKLEDAQARDNKTLIEHYNSEMSRNDKDLELYRSKYEETKAAIEG
jgi:hypothetical protein